MKLHTQGLQTLEDVRQFVHGSQPAGFELVDRDEAYRFIEHTLRRFTYLTLSRADKGVLRQYLVKITGLSASQVTRLIRQYRRTGYVRDRRGRPARPFERYYTKADCRALAQLDRLHNQLSGPATRRLCWRAFHVFGDGRYERLAHISNGHLYNLRASTSYQRQRGFKDHTRASRHNQIGERRPPEPEGRPGYLRVDSVHQGDQDGVKGVYHINVVDAVTQFQFVASVAQISENRLLPALEALLEACPFVVHGFHADNGSEYINHRVAALLDKLQVTEFTKSRPRQCTDNALVESKNASVVRKHLGYGHIPAEHADAVDAFNRQVLTPYLNYHRPCLFARKRVDAKGKVRRYYPDDAIRTPYETLKALPEAESYLREGITFEQLDAIAYAISDNEAARRLNEARVELFQSINRSRNPAA